MITGRAPWRPHIGRAASPVAGGRIPQSPSLQRDRGTELGAALVDGSFGQGQPWARAALVEGGALAPLLACLAIETGLQKHQLCIPPVATPQQTCSSYLGRVMGCIWAHPGRAGPTHRSHQQQAQAEQEGASGQTRAPRYQLQTCTPCLDLQCPVPSRKASGCGSDSITSAMLCPWLPTSASGPRSMPIALSGRETPPAPPSRPPMKTLPCKHRLVAKGGDL